jgi:hypothetical protein
MNSFFASLFSGVPVQLHLFGSAVLMAWDAVWWIVLPVVAALLFWEFWRLYLHVKFVKEINFKLLEIKVPKTIMKTPKAMEQIFAAAHAPYSYGIRFYDKYIKGKEEFWMSFEMVGRAGESHFYLRVPGQYRHMMESAIYGQYPDAEIIDADEYMDQFPKILPNANFDLSGFEEILRHESYLPIRTYPSFEESVEEQRLDPISPIMEAMSRLRGDEQLWYQIIVRPTGEDFKKEGDKKIAQIYGIEDKKKASANPFAGFGLGVTLGDVITSPFRHPSSETAAKKEEKPKQQRVIVTPGEKEITEGIELKISKIAFDATVRFLYVNRRGVPDAGFMNTVHGFVRQFNTQHMNSLKPNSGTSTASWSVHGLFKKTRIQWRKRLIWEAYRNIVPLKGNKAILNIEELATIMHFPITAVSTTELEKIGSRKGSPPAGVPLIEEE